MDNQTDLPKSRPAFAWRAMTSVLIFAAFAVLLISGIMLFVSPPGRVANWTNWTLLGFTKKQWTALHIWFSLLFLVTTLFHLIFNWRPMLGYFKDRIARRFGFRWEWAVALAICGGVFAGTQMGVPPFSSLLAFNEDIKESWDQPRGRAPIPHAELLTLADLSKQAGIEYATASNRLVKAGIRDFTPETIMEALAEKQGKSAQQIYESIIAPPEGGSKGGGKGHGAAGGGGGGGVGWKTLQQFCQDEGIALEDALGRLQAKKILGKPEQTLREIAVNNGYERPFELLEILRGKPGK